MLPSLHAKTTSKDREDFNLFVIHYAIRFAGYVRVSQHNEDSIGSIEGLISKSESVIVKSRIKFFPLLLFNSFFDTIFNDFTYQYNRIISDREKLIDWITGSNIGAHAMENFFRLENSFRIYMGHRKVTRRSFWTRCINTDLVSRFVTSTKRHIVDSNSHTHYCMPIVQRRERWEAGRGGPIEEEITSGDTQPETRKKKKKGLCIENSRNVVVDTRNQYRSYCSSQGIVFVVR